MKYYSTNGKAAIASFKEAVYKGLPEDNGLYMPEYIPELPASFFDKMSQLSLAEIGHEVMSRFVGDEIPDSTLSDIIQNTLSFDIPLVEVNHKIHSLELFHGPTFAFKDIGARFLARCLSYFSNKQDIKLTVLVATSGDTGSAVAQGFFQVPNIEVVILYPSGKISHFQEQQMTTLGNNITALEIDGTFDDCQKLVKQAFLDEELNQQVHLTSANSINIARMLPQSIYYFHALSQLSTEKSNEVVISVPSGNYGNLTAGLVAQRMGLPIKHFLACSNVNDAVPEYLKTAEYIARPSKQTMSNAMDVGDPSNFVRMLNLFENSHKQMSKSISGYSFTDAETKQTIKQVYEECGYILDPHGAVGYCGLSKYLNNRSNPGIFLETAHPYKFKESVEPQLGINLSPVTTFDQSKSKSIPFKNDFNELRAFLAD